MYFASSFPSPLRRRDFTSSFLSPVDPFPCADVILSKVEATSRMLRPPSAPWNNAASLPSRQPPSLRASRAVCVFSRGSQLLRHQVGRLPVLVVPLHGPAHVERQLPVERHRLLVRHPHLEEDLLATALPHLLHGALDEGGPYPLPPVLQEGRDGDDVPLPRQPEPPHDREAVFDPAHDVAHDLSA